MQGILIVDKPMEWTSFDVIAKLRGILGTRKLGHSGTLDPMATGVLPVFCGGASKAVDLQLDHTKTYCARLRLGMQTDTGDITGTVLETAPVTAGEAELLAVLPRFLGPQMQTPPMYSAVKINGQPLYKLAREGVTVERKARPIEILDIRYGGSPVENEYVLTVRCSKGTYIRTLLEDIAAAMGQKGTMSALRRTTAGVYTEADAHTLEEIQAAKDAGPEALQALMLPVESVFESLPLLVAEPRVEQHLYNGCPTSRYPAADGRMTGIPAEWYDAVTADYILVEADGSRRLPLKVHRSFEPVIPPGTELVIQMAGLSALGQTVGECVHCYHEMGLAAGQTVDEERITKILLRGFEQCSTIPRRLAALNQADTAARLVAGETIQRQLAWAGVRAAVTRLKGEVFCLF